MLIGGATVLSKTSFNAANISDVHFCALAYRPTDWEEASPQAAPVVMLALKDQTDHLSFLVHPELHAIVRREDLAFVESLVEDFIERAKLHPAALFEHLSSLGVGSLVTHETGESLSEYPYMESLSASFVEFG
jgi:hypothetical protein